ncbi:MAG: hypothetical protein LUC88_03060, partial [Prevotella sp.]|nr:hypothetical protein [Prevotella sp.]
YKEFARKHPNGYYVSDINDRILDYNLWIQAKNTNTIDAYTNYLKKSTILAYKEEANNSIDSIKAEQEWQKCKDSNDVVLLNNFIKRYPNSSYVNQAKYLINIIRGESNYKQGNESFAYSYLKEANDYQSLSGQPAKDFNELKEKRTYNDIIISNDKIKIKNYLNSLPPSSPYYNAVLNHYAILLARDLSGYSPEYKYNEALSYANDEQTKRTVKAYINRAKKDRSNIKHHQKMYAHQLWWKNRFKFGWNVVHIDILSETMSIGTGVKCRLGRWNDLVNFLLGAEFTYIVYYSDNGYYDETTGKIGSQIEIPATLRFNICNITESSKFYVGCTIATAFKISESDNVCMNNMSIAIQPEVGIAGNHCDFGMYYRKYPKNYNIVNTMSDVEDQRIGCFFTWFF